MQRFNFTWINFCKFCGFPNKSNHYFKLFKSKCLAYFWRWKFSKYEIWPLSGYFCVGVFFDWVHNQTWVKKCYASAVFRRVTRFLPDLIAKIFLFFLFKWPPSFTWELIWTWLFKKCFPKMRDLIELDS